MTGTSLLYHESTSGAPCEQRSGAVRSCQYIGRNDNHVNDPAEWDAFIAAIKDGPRVGVLEPGIWTFNQSCLIPNADRMVLRGEGQEISILGIVCEEYGDALAVENPASTRLQGFGIWTGGYVKYGLTLYSTPGAGADRNQIADISISGNFFSHGCLGLVGSGQTSARNLNLYNYSTSNPSPVVDIVGAPGQWFTDCELHSYVNGADVVRIEDSNRVVFRGGIIGGDAPATSSRQRSYIHTKGDVSAVSFWDVLCQSDVGYPPEHWAFNESGNFLNVRGSGGRIQINGTPYGNPSDVTISRDVAVDIPFV